MYLRTLAAILCVALARAANAQDAALRGAVVDDSGGALPGAVIVLAPEAGGNPRETTSGESGQFGFSRVQAGRYRLRVTLAGFQPADVALAIDSPEPSPIRVALTVGFGEEVTVDGDAGGALSAARNADALEFDPEALRQLPTDMQNLQAVIQNFTAADALGGVSFVVDGVETDAADIPAAAIHRLWLNRNPYAAEFKSPGKARAEIETQHGSRRYFHGGGALFVRNSALDAQNALAASPGDMERLLSEGNVGGPLSRKGWSFFASGQRLASRDSSVVSAIVPTGPLTANAPTDERRTTFMARVDSRPKKTAAMSLRYDAFDEVERGRGVGGLRLVDQAYATTERRQRVQIGDHRVRSNRFVQDLHVEAGRAERRDGSPATAPAVVVAGAFVGGAPQVFTAHESTSIGGDGVATITVGRHSVRIGAKVKARRIDATDGSNFGGTFTFASLADFSAGRPILYTARAGDPRVSFADAEADAFTEADFRPLDSVRITAGLRYDWQSRVADRNNVSPRVSIALAPAGRRTVIRAGAGLFYRSLPDNATARALLFGGGRLREGAVAAPAFGRMDPAAGFPTLSAWHIDSDLRAPAALQTTFGVERTLWRKTSIAADYLELHTSNAFRSRDINAPDAVTGIRPDPARLHVNQIESTGASVTRAATATFRGRLGEFKGSIQYVLSRTIDDASGVFDLPADNHNLAAERGRADFDRRHRLNVAGTYGWFDDHIRLGALVTAASGAPFDITTGSDDNHDLNATDRPAGVTRNTGIGPPLFHTDVRLTTVLRVPRPPSADPESLKRDQLDNLELNVDVFNALNVSNATTVIGVLASPRFGQAATMRPPRSLQVSLRYRF